MKKYLLFSLLVFGFVSNSTAASFKAEATKTEKKTFSVQPGGELRLHNNDGQVVITSWDKNEIEVVYTKTARANRRERAEDLLEEVEVAFDHSGNRLRVINSDVRRRRTVHYNLELFGRRWSNAITVDFEIKVPRKFNIELVNDDGDVDITSIEGEVVVELDDGNMFLSDIRTDNLELSLDDGQLTVENVVKLSDKTNIIVSVDDGRINMDKVQTETLEINTDDSDVFLRDLSVVNLSADMDDGDFESDLTLEGDGRVVIRVDNGSVELSLPQNVSAFFDLESEDSRINTDFDLEVQRSRGRRWVREKVGSGQSDVRVKTDGRISIRKR